MANPRIRSKRSSVEGKVPAASQLLRGEFAVNSYDGKVYILKDQTSVGIATTTVTVNPWDEPNGVGAGVSYSSDVNVLGVVTATSFVGDGSGLTNINVAGVSTFSGDYNHLYNTPTIPTNNNQLTNGAGYITGYTVTESDVTSHQAALSITESQISDFGTYATAASVAGIDTSGFIGAGSTFSGNYNHLYNKPTIPTNNNQLTNGAGYITSSDLSSYATTSYVDTEVAGLVDSAPGTLNTLNELAAALGDDANFSTTVTNSIAGKLPLSGGQMTGNITMSGAQTVDGRDLSVDGAKLDGIESGATADQTASEILTAIKTVDGSGSGLDADTLDGVQASGFLVSTSDSEQEAHFGDVRYNQGATWIRVDPRINEAGYNGNNINMHWYASTSTGGSYGQVGHALYNGSAYQYLHTVSGQSHLYINNNKVWNAGNDGSGSGLDADTLDGVQGASFLRSDVADTYTRLNTVGSTNNARFQTSGSWGTRHQTDNGYIDFGPANTSWAHIYTDRPAFYFNTELYVNNNKVWNAGNDGSGSGLDADTLDGIHSTGFLSRTLEDSNRNLILKSGSTTSGTGIELRRSDNTFQGQIYATGSATGFLDSSWGNWDLNKTHNGALVLRQGGVNYTVAPINTGSYSGEYNIPIHTGGYLYPSPSGGAVTILGNGGVNALRVSGNTVWNAGNDGSGSGLDADTVDGVQASAIHRTVATASAAVGPGWITVATNTSGRKHGEIIVSDSDSGDHAFIRIDWMRSYADSNFTVLNCGGHGNRITGARVLYQTSNNTYGEKILQVYVTTASTYRVQINQVQNQSGWSAHTVHTPVVESPSGYSVHGNTLSSLETYGLAHEEGIQAGGSILAGGDITSSSDISLKENVVTYENALDKVLAMRGVEYDRKDQNGKHEVGLIAQEVENIIPEVVAQNNGIKSIAYGKLTAVLIEAIKEQQEQIKHLQQQLNIGK